MCHDSLKNIAVCHTYDAFRNISVISNDMGTIDIVQATCKSVEKVELFDFDWRVATLCNVYMDTKW